MVCFYQSTEQGDYLSFFFLLFELKSIVGDDMNIK